MFNLPSSPSTTSLPWLRRHPGREAIRVISLPKGTLGCSLTSYPGRYLITGKNNKEKTTKLNNKLHSSVSILCCITSSLDDSFNATRHAVYQLLTFMGSYLIPIGLDAIVQLLTSIWLMFMQLLFHNPP